MESPGMHEVPVFQGLWHTVSFVLGPLSTDRSEGVHDSSQTWQFITAFARLFTSQVYQQSDASFLEIWNKTKKLLPQKNGRSFILS